MKEFHGPVYDRNAYAGFIRRSLAWVIDLALIGLAQWATPWAWYYLAPNAWITVESYHWVFVGVTIASLVYLIGLRFTERGTIGYRLVGIRYAYMLGDPPDFWTLAYRSLLGVVLMFVFALDHIWILVDKHKQAWHDKLSGFYVIKRRAEPIGSQRIVRRVEHFGMLTFMVWEPAEPRVSESAPT